jgi:hypothetical protein
MKPKKKLQTWLGIVQPKDYDKSLNDAVEAYREHTNGLETEMWKHRNLLKKRATTNCPQCHKQLLLWPLETEAYYTRDGEAYHVACYDASLERSL